MAQSASEKVLIVSNCNMHQLNMVLKLWMPDCEIRGVLVPRAKAWLAEGHQDFIEFLKDADYLIGVPRRNMIEIQKGSGKFLRIPPINFSGLHPDCISDPGMKKTPALGHRYSNIAMACYLMGIPTKKACGYFNHDVYEKLGYLTHYATSKNDFTKTYKEKYGVDLATLFEDWERTGVYMYQPLHPRKHVTFDIVSEFLIHNGLVSRSLLEDNRIRLTVNKEDPLSLMRQWPVYSEIADAVGIEGGSYDWIRGKGPKGYKKLNLLKFIEISYEVFDASLSDLDGRRREMELYMDAVAESRAA